ncbi:MAG: hypothetical protein ACT4NT_06150 [Nitrososphaerota archaeon]
MNKITTLMTIATAAIIFGIITPDLAENATENDSDKDKYGNKTGKNYNHDDHDDDHDDCDDDDHGNKNKYWNKTGKNFNKNNDYCEDDDRDDGGVVNDPPTVKVYKIVINNEENPVPSVASFGIKLNNTQITTNGTLITVAQDKPVILTESGLAGYEFVEIRGDGHCPENLGGTITLDNAQHIECYIVNQPAGSSGPIEPGVIFHYNTLQFSFADPNFGDSCSASGNMSPCVELANANLDGSILVVDEELKTDTTIVLFSVVEQGKIDQNPPRFATSPLCVLSGMGPHTTDYAQEPDTFPVTNPTGTLGFEFQCSLVEADMFKVSYALIETEQQP